MSNRRFITIFLVGIAMASLLLVVLSFRPASVVAPGGIVSIPFGPDDADAIEIVWQRAHTNRLARTDQGVWRLVYPFPALADAVAVARMLDAVLLLKPGDMLTASDMRALGRTARDFGFDPSRLALSVTAGARTVRLEFGGSTPSGSEVYVRIGGNGPVFTMSAAAFSAVPPDMDAFRRRRVFEAPLASIVAADFRMPGATFVKLVHSGGVWQIVQPDKAPADAAVVNDVLSRLLALRAESFVWPDAWAADADADPATGKVKAARLASYGIDDAEGLSVALWTSPTAVERLVFGAPAGSNLVHALVHDGSEVVTVDAAMSSLCRAGHEKFLDARIFPFGADSLRSVSVTVEGTVYVLAAGTNGQWRVESPVVAPADASAVAELLDKVLRLKQNDRLPDGAAPAATVVVSAGAPAFPAETNLMAVAVRPDFLSAPANLRSKRILTVPPGSVKKLTVASAGGETVVEQDAERMTWRLVKTSAPSASIRVSADGVSRVLSVLADISAVSVENLNAMPEDFKRCGLSRPAFTISADVDAADAVRRNLLLGNAAPGGGRYATAGGADAIFIVSRETVASLTVPLVESDMGGGGKQEPGDDATMNKKGKKGKNK